MDKDTPQIFERPLYLARQQKASQATNAILGPRIATDLAERLAIITRVFDNGAVIAQLGSPAIDAIAASGKVKTLVHITPGTGDDLKLKTHSLNAAFSLLDLQTINDVPGYLIQVARALKPDGLLMICLFAGETLHELRESWLAAELELTSGASPRVAPMIGIRELGSLLQRAGLALPVADTDRATVRYSDCFALMQEIRKMGFANPLVGRSNRFVPRKLLSRVAEYYHDHYADADGRIRSTIEIAWANAWKPHESQPQPLKPGSAKTSLANALRVPEIKLKD